MADFNIFNNPEPYEIYLCKPNGQLLYELNGIDDTTALLTKNLNNQYELAFDYFRFINDPETNELIESNGYHKLAIGMNLFVKDVGFFRMKYPPYSYSDDIEKKSISAFSIESELENKDITLKINTGEEDSLEYLVQYEDGETENLLNDYTDLPYDYIVFYNTFPEQLQEIQNKYSDTTYTDANSIAEIKKYCDLIPRLKSKLTTDANGDTTVDEYVSYTYDNSGENIVSVKLTGFNSRIQVLISFYTKYRDQLSLVSLLTEKCSPNWKFGNIEESLYNKKFQFDIEDKNIYSFLTQDLSSAANYIFDFDIINRIINIKTVDSIGDETGVVIEKQNLLNQLEVSCDEENLYTRFNVSGGDELNIDYINFGESYITDISYFLSAKDENGNRIYVSDTLADKYKLYEQDREIARKKYSDLTAEYNHYVEDISELQYRVPNDIVATDWGTYKMDELEAAVTTYNNLLCTLQTCYKEDYGTTGCNSDGSINENYIRNTEYWYDYYAYKQALDQISEAIDCLANDESYRGITDEQVLAKINAWKTEWSLYGTVELQNKIVVYENNLKVLVDGEAIILKDGSEEAKTWDELTGTEKQEYGNLEVNYQYEVYNKQYQEKKSCQEYLNGLLKKLDSLKASQQEVQNIRVQITTLVSFKKYDRIELNKVTPLANVTVSNSFTEEEIFDLNLLFIDKSYSNENIIVTSIDSIEDQIQIEYDLLDDAREQLSIESQPQISFTADIDNLLAMSEFKDFNFDIGNYVLVQYYDNYYVKLRLSSIEFNPKIPSDSLSVTFTNYIKSRSKRSDVSYILSQSNGSSSSGSSSGSGSGSGVGVDEISNTLLSKLLNTEMFGSKVSNIILDTLKVNELNAKYAKFDGLAKGVTIIDGKSVQTGYIRDKYYNGKNGDISNTKGSVINLEDGIFSFAGGSIKYDGKNVTFGENVTLSWNQITDKEDVGGLTEEQVTQITKNTISTSYIKSLNLTVGNEIQMGEDAVISWDQVSDADSKVTQITKDTVSTSYVNALNVTAKEVNSDWVYAGGVKADQINTGTLDASKITVKGLVVGENVEMGENATISWDQVSNKNIGTRNYVSKSGDYASGGETGWTSSNTSYFNVTVNDGYTRITRSGTANTYYAKIPLVTSLVKAETYTLSMKVRRSTVANLNIIGEAKATSTDTYTVITTFQSSQFQANAWTTLSYTFKANEAYNYIAIRSNDFTTSGQTIDFEYIQVEKGSVVSDWKQASEDIEDDIPDDAYITKITKDTVTTSYVNALNVTAKEVNSDWVYAGTVKADQISTGTLDATKLTVKGLTVGDNVTLGDNAVIKWNQVEDADTKVTQITKDTVTTSYVNALKITANSVISDAIKSANYKYTSGTYSDAGTFLNLSNGAFTSKNFAINSSGNLFAQGEIYATKGSLEDVVIKTLYVYDEMNDSNMLAITGSGESLDIQCALLVQEKLIAADNMDLEGHLTIGGGSSSTNNIIFQDVDATHECRIYGSNSSSTTGIGIYDAKNDRTVFAYNDTANTVSSKSFLEYTELTVSTSSGASAVSYNVRVFPFLKTVVLAARFTTNALTAGTTYTLGKISSATTYKPKLGHALATWVNSSSVACNCAAHISSDDGTINFHSTSAVSSGRYVYVSGTWTY